MSFASNPHPLHEMTDEAEALDPALEELIQGMKQNMAPFAGNDPNTSDSWYCKQCYKHENEEGTHLLRCARCHIVYYCSRECQREDFREHVDECKSFQRLTAEMNTRAEELRANRSWFSQPTDPPRNVFETDVGRFWGLLDTRGYCRARGQLAREIAHIAHWYEVRPLLEVVLGHRLELLRLISSDNMGLRDEVPFTLLSLNRDEDCYAFIKHWARRLSTSNSEDGIEQLHKSSREGEWLYGHGDRYEDIFEAVPENDERYFSLAFLAALCIIKLRIIAKYEADGQQYPRFEKTKLGCKVDEVGEHMREAVLGGAEQAARVQRQKELVGRYFDIIQENNPTLLPAIINPGPLKNEPPPAYTSPGTPAEAWGVLMNCNRLFARIPGVEARLEDLFGRNPQYDYNTTLS